MSLAANFKVTKKDLCHRWDFPVPDCHEDVLGGAIEFFRDSRVYAPIRGFF